MNYPSIWLRREGNDAVVLIEHGGEYVEILREPADSCFSHCVHDGGIKKRIEEAAYKLAMDDLVASGGISEAP